MSAQDLIRKLDDTLIQRQVARGVALPDAKAFARGYLQSTLASIIDNLGPKDRRLAIAKLSTLIQVNQEVINENA